MPRPAWRRREIGAALRGRAGERYPRPGMVAIKSPPSTLRRLDLHREVGLLYHDPGPHLVEQLALGHQLPWSRGHREEQVEGAAADRRDLAAHQQHTLERPQLPLAESS